MRGMKSRSFAPLLVVLAHLVGCASPVDSAPPALGTQRSALGEEATFPPRVEAPLGASRAEILRDIPAHGDNPAFWKFEEGNGVTRDAVARNSRGYVDAEGAFVCANCMLDGAVFTTDKVRLVNSSAVGAVFRAAQVPADPGNYPPVTAQSVELVNTDARGASFEHPTLVVGYRMDLRGSSGTVVLDVKPNTPLQNVDLSGHLGSVITMTDAGDLRMTGAEGSLDLRGNVRDVRLDGMKGAVTLSGGTVAGKLALDDAKVDVQLFRPTTFDAAKVTLQGAKGTLTIADTASLAIKGGSFEGGGEMRLQGKLGKLSFSGKVSWPVGEGALIPDDSLTTVDFKGVTLAPIGGATWPKAALSLDGLTLTGGGFGAGVDLSHVTLRGAHLEGVDFGKVVLSRLDGQKASGANFENAHLEGASFVGPEDNFAISGVNFTGAGLRGADLSGVSGKATFDRLDAGKIAGASKATSFAHAKLGASTFDHAGIQYVSFESAHLESAVFTNAIADFADFSNASFVAPTIGDPTKVSGNQTLAGATSMKGATFDGADLRGVNLTGLDLSSDGSRVASFAYALLCDATLTNTKMRGAQLTHAKIDVDGLITLPGGETIACAPGARDGLDTASTTDHETECPDASAPASGASCSDAQLKQKSTVCPHRKHGLAGKACTSDCDCARSCNASTNTCT